MTRTALVACLAFMVPCFGQSMYVTDELEITMRTGPSTENRIVNMVRSGTPVEIVTPDNGNGYAQVREPGGREGWVLSRFLRDQPGAAARLQVAEQRIAELQQSTGESEERLRTIAQLQSSIARLENENQVLSAELESMRTAAANVLSLSRDADDLQSAVDDLVLRNEELLREKLILEDHTAPKWFLRGAAVMVGGLVLGLFVARLSGRRRTRHWGDL